MAAGCIADFPEPGTGQVVPPRGGDPRYGDVAVCVGGGRQQDCTKQETCGQSVVADDEPDQKAVDLSRCTLQLSYARGTVITRPGAIDLVVHLGSTVTGIARVEASRDGLEGGAFTVVGFINGLPAGDDNPRCRVKCASRACTSTTDRCEGDKACWRGAGGGFGYCLTEGCQPGGLALVDLSSGSLGAPVTGCNTVSNALFFRLSQYSRPGVPPGSVTVDAVEATAASFQPRGNQ